MEEELALCSEVREKGAARACRREGRMGLVASSALGKGAVRARRTGTWLEPERIRLFIISLKPPNYGLC